MTHKGCEKIAIKARFTYINKQQSDFAILRGFYFHKTLRENKVLTKISEFTVLITYASKRRIRWCV